MKKLVLLIILSVMLTGCGTDPEISRFEKEMTSFCDKLYDIDASINSITNLTAEENGLEEAVEKLLFHLELLEDEFKKFANMDFPNQYDYLEELADQAGDYMSEAVKSYKTAYAENYTESIEEYAQENYSRAYRRVQFVLDVLHGEDPGAQ